MTAHRSLRIWTDGGARGNPGPAGIGVVVKDNTGKTLAEISEYIGEATNNQAEYRALIAALHTAKSLGAEEIDVYLDSQLIVEQINRNYKVKDADLAKLFVEAWNVLQGFRKTHFSHVPRERNREADLLVNQAIDTALRSGV